MIKRNPLNRPKVPFYDVYGLPIEQACIFEEWKMIDIDGVVKNYYMINNFGEIKNIKGQYLKPSMINSEYLTYKLYTGEKCNKKYKTLLVSRLVDYYFNPNPIPQNSYTVDHIDMNVMNNWSINLRRITQSENNEVKIKNLCSYGSNNYHAKFSIPQLIIIVNELNEGNNYSNILNIIGVEDTDNNRDYIGNIKRGKTYVRELELLGLKVQRLEQ